MVSVRPLNIVILGIFLASLLISIWISLPFLGVILVGAVTAYMLNPFIEKILSITNRVPRMPKVFKKRAFAVTLAIFITIIPVIYLFFYTINILWSPDNVNDLLKIMYKRGDVSSMVEARLEAIGLEQFSDQIGKEINDIMTGFTTSAFDLIRSFLRTGINLLMKMAIFLIAVFYLALDGPRLKNTIIELSPNPRFAKEFSEHLDRIANGLFIGHLLTSIIIGVIAGVGFGIILETSTVIAILIGAITAIFALLPIIGPWLVYLPITLWAILIQNDVTQAIVVLLFGSIFLSTIPDIYIRPMLAKRASKIHPFLILLGFIGGPLTLGLKGLILGPLALGLLQTMIELYRGKSGKTMKKMGLA